VQFFLHNLKKYSSNKKTNAFTKIMTTDVLTMNSKEINLCKNGSLRMLKTKFDFLIIFDVFGFTFLWCCSYEMAKVA
jgi:hypothetical protein